MSITRLFLFVLFSLTVALGACGGAEPTIKHRLPMGTLAQTPPEERGPVSDAYRKHYEAQLKLDHVGFLLSDIKYEIKIADAKKAERKQRLRVAKLEGQRNEAFFQEKLAKAADTLVNGLKKQERAQEEYMRYLKAQRTYLERERSASIATLAWSEAAFELAKAKLAKKRNTTPNGFRLDRFVAQEERARATSQKNSQKSKDALASAKAKKQAWKNAAK